MPRLLQELAVARVDGRYGKILVHLLKQDVLVIDDWGLAPLDDPGRRDPPRNPGRSLQPPFDDRLKPTAGLGLA
jgi:hypothetical protein